MELAQKAKKVIVLMNHVNRHGESKVKKQCDLPLTARACVKLIITEMAVMEVTDQGLLLKEIMSALYGRGRCTSYGSCINHSGEHLVHSIIGYV